MEAHFQIWTRPYQFKVGSQNTLSRYFIESCDLHILFQIKASSLDNLKQEIIQSFDLDPMSALMLAYCGKKLTELPRGKV